MKVSQLLKELQDARLHYKKMLVELEALEHVKAENTVSLHCLFLTL